MGFHIRWDDEVASLIEAAGGHESPYEAIKAAFMELAARHEVENSEAKSLRLLRSLQKLLPDDEDEGDKDSG